MSVIQLDETRTHQLGCSQLAGAVMSPTPLLFPASLCRAWPCDRAHPSGVRCELNCVLLQQILMMSPDPQDLGVGPYLEMGTLQM